MATQGLTAHVTELDDGITISLQGSLDDHCDAAHLIPRTAPYILFDLDGIHRITSYGVIHWLSAMRSLDGKVYAFANCRRSLVRQFNMIRGFGRKGKVLSIYLPYFCASCSSEYDELLDLVANFATVRTARAPPSHCRTCGKLAVFDAAETYFGFGNDYGEPRLAPSMRKLTKSLSERATGASRAGGDAQHLRVLRDELNATVDRLARHRGKWDT